MIEIKHRYTGYAEAFRDYFLLSQEQNDREEEARMIQHWQETGNGEAFGAAMMAELRATDTDADGDPFKEEM